MKNKKILVFNKYWFFYFIVKLLYMLFAIFIYSKLTTLGDTSRWMSGTIKIHELSSMFINSSYIMDFVGGISSTLFGKVLGNLPFLILSFYGIYYSVSRLKLVNKELVFILFLLSFPSFGIWCSIAGKEAIGVFFMGIILGYIIDMIEEQRYKIKFIEIFAFYLLFVFKPQYSVSILSLMIYIIISQKLRLFSYGKTILFLIHILLALIAFWIFRDIINEISFMIPKHFSLNAGSTRMNTIWINNYDIFYHAFYGMFIAFWGLTFEEIVLKPIQGIVFIESFFIVCFLVSIYVYLFFYTIKKLKFNIYIFSLMNISLFWLLFAQYPFGVFNPGSALRYRENFYGFLIVFFYFLYLKIKKGKNYE